MSTNKLNIEEVFITPERAVELLKLNTKNRQIKKSTVEYYMSQIRRGQFALNGDTIKISDKNTLMDGQHRLQAVVETGIGIHSIIVTGVASEVFATIDTGKARTNGDIFSVEGVKYHNMVASMVSAYMIWRRSKSYNESRQSKVYKISKQDVLEKYKENPDTWDLICETGRVLYNKSRFLTPSEAGAIMGILIFDKKHLDENVFTFFKQLFGIEPAENRTLVLLRDKLSNAKMSRISLDPNFKRAVIIKTWNAYITGKTYSKLVYKNGIEAIPEFI